MVELSQKLLDISKRVSASLTRRFEEIDAVAEHNTVRVLEAFSKSRLSESHFMGSTGYGYDDRGREILDEVYAALFGTERALVRVGFVNGTHAIASALFGALSPGDTLVSAVGAPYDTLGGVIGSLNKGFGSLRDYGVSYREVPVKDGGPDIGAICGAVRERSVKALLVQRSRGYSGRRSLSLSDIGGIAEAVRRVRDDVIIIVDNCYGEFVETSEPTAFGADLAAGSLIKNPGGGLAPAGGYIAGRADLVERAANRMTAPGIGGHCGATLGVNRSLFQGLFMAPHTVAQALKTAVFCSGVMEALGYKVSPRPLDPRFDIIQSVEFGAPEPLLRFCRGIQKGAPVDSFASPEPWDMPGYDCPVVMAAGAFIQGASIELSADAPMRPPYTAFMQGGLTFESGKYGVLMSASELLEGGL